MEEDDYEGEFILGWPGKKRLARMEQTDAEGRVIYAQSPILEQDGLITPVDASYIVAQIGMPEPVHPLDWEFEVCGEVERPTTFSLEDLRKMPARTVRAVTECAGNDADFFEYLEDKLNFKPKIVHSRDQVEDWFSMHKGGDDVSMEDILAAPRSTNLCSAGEWTGTPLREVLDRVGVKEGAVSVRLEGFDRGRPDPVRLYRALGTDDIEVHDPGEINFDKALPMEKAFHEDTILAWAHNGDSLLHVHGAPVRLIVPGWAGNWWIKWIHKIEVHDHMPECYHQTYYFVFGKSVDDPVQPMMTALGCKSIIKSPRDSDSPLKVGEHLVEGLAWSGEGEIVGVEVSVDGGATWQDAHVEYSPDRWLWKRWSYLWQVETPGQYSIMARATDEQDRVQPVTEWNYQLKHFDGIIPVDVTIEA